MTKEVIVAVNDSSGLKIFHEHLRDAYKDEALKRFGTAATTAVHVLEYYNNTSQPTLLGNIGNTTTGLGGSASGISLLMNGAQTLISLFMAGHQVFKYYESNRKANTCKTGEFTSSLMFKIKHVITNRFSVARVLVSLHCLAYETTLLLRWAACTSPNMNLKKIIEQESQTRAQESQKRAQEWERYIRQFIPQKWVDSEYWKEPVGFQEYLREMCKRFEQEKDELGPLFDKI